MKERNTQYTNIYIPNIYSFGKNKILVEKTNFFQCLCIQFEDKIFRLLLIIATLLLFVETWFNSIRNVKCVCLVIYIYIYII